MTNLVNKEITLKGFKGGSDETDDLVIWVVGDESEITRITAALGGKVASVVDVDIGVGPLTFEEGRLMGFDFDLPKDEGEFLTTVDRRLASYVEKMHVTNKYKCMCGEEWALGDCDSFHNDRCPSCNKEIGSYLSIEHKDSGDNTHRH
jgi:hypothetical protein